MLARFGSPVAAAAAGLPSATEGFASRNEHRVTTDEEGNSVLAIVDSPLFKELLDVEFRLRISRAHDALRSLCRAVCLHGALNVRHAKVSGQNETTRSRSFITRAVEQKEAIRRYYNYNRQVLLSMNRELPSHLREVRIQDVTPPRSDAFSERGSSRNTVSWIWNRRTDSGESGEQIERDQVERWALEGEHIVTFASVIVHSLFQHSAWSVMCRLLVPHDGTRKLNYLPRR